MQCARIFYRSFFFYYRSAQDKRTLLVNCQNKSLSQSFENLLDEPAYGLIQVCFLSLSYINLLIYSLFCISPISCFLRGYTECLVCCKLYGEILFTLFELYIILFVRLRIFFCSCILFLQFFLYHLVWILIFHLSKFILGHDSIIPLEVFEYVLVFG